VQLVDEEDDLPLRVGNFLQHRFQSLFELPAVLRAGDERAHIERDDAFALQPFGHVAANDPSGEPFDDRGLANARLPDEHRVVLRAARKDLNDPADLFVAPDDRIQLALARELRQVAAVTFERLIRAFRIFVRDALRPAHRGQGLEDRVAGHALLFQQLRGRGPAAFVRDRDEEVFGADVFVLEPVGFGLRLVGDETKAG
jgi:hypothetical protein